MWGKRLFEERMKQELDHYCLYVWEMKNYIFHYIPWFIKNIGDEELFRGSLLLKISEIKIYFRGISFKNIFRRIKYFIEFGHPLFIHEYLS